MAGELPAAPVPEAVPQAPVAPFLGNVWAQNFEDVNGRPPSQADFMPAAAAGPGSIQPPPPVPFMPSHGEAPPPVDPVMFASHAPADWSPPQFQQAAGAMRSPMSGIAGEIGQVQKFGERAANQQFEADRQRAADTLSATEQYTRQISEQQAARQKAWSQVESEYNNAVKDLQGSRIDANRVWSSKSTGDKVGAMVGMVLSGIGSGVTGQPNLAVQLLQKQIDNDIDAQKAEMGKKTNLVSMMFQKFGNVDAADAAARLYLGANLEAQLKSAAARAGTPEAMAKMNATLAGIHQNLLPLKMQLAQFQFSMSLMQQGGGLPGNYIPTSSAPPMLSAPSLEGVAKQRQELMERTIPGPGGKLLVAYDSASAQKARDRLSGAAGFEDALGKLQTFGGNKVVPFSTDNANYKRLLKGAAVEYSRMMKGGIPTEGEVEEAEKVLVGPIESAIRGKASWQPVADILHGQRGSIWSTYAGLPAVQTRAR